MEPCPVCGVMLAPKLVEAINNPFLPESCPKESGRGRRRRA